MFNQYDALNQEYKEFDGNVILDDENEFKEFIKSVFGDSKIDYDTTPMSKKTVKQIGMILDKLGLKYKIMTFKDIWMLLGLKDGINHLKRIPCYCVEWGFTQKDGKILCIIVCFKSLYIWFISEYRSTLRDYNISRDGMVELINIIAKCCERVNDNDITKNIDEIDYRDDFGFEKHMHNMLNILEKAGCYIDVNNGGIYVSFEPAGLMGSIIISPKKIELITNKGVKAIKAY